MYVDLSRRGSKRLVRQMDQKRAKTRFKEETRMGPKKGNIEAYEQKNKRYKLQPSRIGKKKKSDK